ncbi:MAG: serine/threonine protein kinase [Deltaproteobacteria bacterium]|nr:serine/threonine protein kinase [Deltaproteobacteria bacterium]
MRNDTSEYVSLPTGHALLNYTISSVLGTGGFAITYKATDNSDGKTVAIKEYIPMDCATRHPDGTVGPRTETTADLFYKGLESFIKEAETLSAFDHPNIAKVLNFFSFPESTGYLVMPFYEGATLTALVRESGGRQTPGEIGVWLGPLLNAMGAMHRRGLLHRDIKPDNIFIEKNGSPILIDFGAARNAMLEHTATMTALLSPGYAPLEQYSSSSALQGPWTDLYALGAVIFFCLSGKLPPGSVERQTALANGEPDPMEAEYRALRRENLSPNLVNAMEASLKLPRKDRIRGVEEFSLALSRRTVLLSDEERKKSLETIETPETRAASENDAPNGDCRDPDPPGAPKARKRRGAGKGTPKDLPRNAPRDAPRREGEIPRLLLATALVAHLALAALELRNYASPTTNTIFLSHTLKVPLSFVVNQWGVMFAAELLAFVFYAKRRPVSLFIYDLVFGARIFGWLGALVAVHVANDELMGREILALFPRVVFLAALLILLNKFAFAGTGAKTGAWTGSGTKDRG